uniref:Uncharacterized protein n=1 Tax=Oryza nivara TaxID=4536 RepID=A0A0E0IUW4_ORYNI
MERGYAARRANGDAFLASLGVDPGELAGLELPATVDVMHERFEFLHSLERVKFLHSLGLSARRDYGGDISLRQLRLISPPLLRRPRAAPPPAAHDSSPAARGSFPRRSCPSLRASRPCRQQWRRPPLSLPSSRRPRWLTLRLVPAVTSLAAAPFPPGLARVYRCRVRRRRWRQRLTLRLVPVAPSPPSLAPVHRRRFNI